MKKILIEVIVSVNNDKHAETIKEEIKELVSLRSNSYEIIMSKEI